jgi:hypothetical protein
MACVLLLVALPVRAEESARWTRAEGSYDLKGNVTETEARTRALQAAQTQAIEKAVGIEVKDRFLDVVIQRGTKETDLTKREIATLALGVVRDKRKLSWNTRVIGTGDESFSRVSVQGEFLVAGRPRSEAPFQLRLKLPRTTVVSGDAMNMEIATTESLHVAIFTLAADDRVYVLYPNRHQEDLVVPKGDSLRLPSPNDPFVLQPTNLEGHREDQEVLRAIASRTALRPPAPDKDGAIALRAFYDWLYGLEPGSWSEDMKTYTIMAADRSP